MSKSASPPASHLEGELFDAVQRTGVFGDSKRFVDAVPLEDPRVIEQTFAAERSTPGFDVRAFVERHFRVPEAPNPAPPIVADTVNDHIDMLWAELRRPQEAHNEYDSLISLPHSHVIPGGRFREGYYWDTYFVAEGLAASDRFDIVEEMIENFSYLIDRFGYVPNGNRRFYLGRSQLPLFSKLVDLLAEGRGSRAALEYLPAMRAEYEFWMDGNGPTSEDPSTGNRVVSLDDAVLNRYWDEATTPRVEAYREDLELGKRLSEERRESFYRDVRAACESGWDFSSRWLADPHDFRSIRTTELLPVDLNASLWYMERRIGDWLAHDGDDAAAADYHAAAAERRAAISAYCWDDSEAYFFDYDWVNETIVSRWTLAGVAPLFFGLASDRQAAGVADALESRFLEPGGLVTTLIHSGQQWDAPNSWAPMQWMAVRGLRRYGFDELAGTIKRRWLEMTEEVFERESRFLEKYDVGDPSRAPVSQDYPPQYGFGWTNAVVLAMQEEPRIGRVGGKRVGSSSSIEALSVPR